MVLPSHIWICNEAFALFKNGIDLKLFHVFFFVFLKDIFFCLVCASSFR